MEQKPITKITVQVDDQITSWEVPHDDCDIEEMLWAFLGLLTTHTWYPETVIKGMKDFAAEMDD